MPVWTIIYDLSYIIVTLIIKTEKFLMKKEKTDQRVLFPQIGLVFT